MRALILDDANHVINAAESSAEFAESQGWIISDDGQIGDTYDADTGVFTPPAPTPKTAEQLLQDLEDARKSAEAEGVKINGIRYAGSADNRQALLEVVQFARESGVTTFASWKDSDGQFHPNHPFGDVEQALHAIAARRSALIALEGHYAAQVLDGELESVEGLSWEV